MSRFFGIYIFFVTLFASNVFAANKPNNRVCSQLSINVKINCEGRLYTGHNFFVAVQEATIRHNGGLKPKYPYRPDFENLVYGARGSHAIFPLLNLEKAYSGNNPHSGYDYIVLDRKFCGVDAVAYENNKFSKCIIINQRPKKLKIKPIPYPKPGVKR